jgi:hypothetical protein
MYPLWEGFFTKHKPATVLIALDRDKLAPSLIQNEVGLEEARPEKKVWMRYVEVWYPEPIPFSWVTSCVLVLPKRPIELSVYNADDAGLEELERAVHALP